MVVRFASERDPCAVSAEGRLIAALLFRHPSCTACRQELSAGRVAQAGGIARAGRMVGSGRLSQAGGIAKAGRIIIDSDRLAKAIRIAKSAHITKWKSKGRSHSQRRPCKRNRSHGEGRSWSGGTAEPGRVNALR